MRGVGAGGRGGLSPSTWVQVGNGGSPLAVPADPCVVSPPAPALLCVRYNVLIVSHAMRLLSRDLKHCENVLSVAGALPKVLRA